MPDISSFPPSGLLTQRQAQVLQATVRHYISTAEPVGSKALTQEYDFSVSSATIRNTMGALEKAGFLYQPHTSAGRIPSDSGYRIYVDQLLVPTWAGSTPLLQQFGGLDWDSWSLEAVLRRAAQILSNLSGYITLITLPYTATARLRHLQLVPVDGDQVMLIVVTTAYETRSTLFTLPEFGGGRSEEARSETEWVEERDRELQILSNFLNSRLRGQLLQDITRLDWQDLEQELQGYADVLQQRLGSVSQQLMHHSSTTQIVMSGIAELLHQPEFTELQQVQALFQLLEEGQEQLWPILVDPLVGDWQGDDRASPEGDRTPIDRSSRPSREASAPSLPLQGGALCPAAAHVSEPGAAASRKTSPSLRVYIGAENPLEPLRACSLVSALYYRDSHVAGSVGVLGPTRMAYEQAIAVVEATAAYLSQALSPDATA
ncbi:MAG: HrcA family transcriptional regulator [Prochlorothrix sp.]